MTYEEPLMSTRPGDPQNSQFILGIDVDDWVRFSFLQQSAQYLGVYRDTDPFETTADEHLVN